MNSPPKVIGVLFGLYVEARKRRMDSIDSTSSEGDVFLSYTDQSGGEEEICRVLRHSLPEEAEKADVDEADCNYLNEVAFLILSSSFSFSCYLLDGPLFPNKQNRIVNLSIRLLCQCFQLTQFLLLLLILE